MDVLVYSILCCLLFIPLWLFVRRPKVRLPPGPKGKLLIGVATDLNPKTAHLTLAKWAETHGALYSFRVFGLTSVVISDVRLIRKAYSSEAFQGVLNDRPESFVGKYLAYNYSDVGFAKYHDATVKLRKCLHKALHFYGDGVKKFEKLFTSELEKIVDEFQKSSANLVDPREVLEHSFCRLVFTLLLGRTQTKEDTMTTSFVWDYLSNANLLLDPTLDTVLQKLPFLRFVPGKFRTFFNDVIGKRNQILDFFYHQQKVSI